MSLPFADKETFIGEIDDMDLSELKDKVFGVAVGLGERDSPKFACTTLMAPLNFYEMVEAVADTWQNQQMHAKAFVLKKTIEGGLKLLDECTIDFIEARYLDILGEMLLEPETVEYAYRARILETQPDETSESDTGPR